MNIHEYQAKAVLREFGVIVPRGHAAFSVDEAVKAAKDLGSPVVVVKAQIHAGGRGKAGGVKVCRGHDAAHKAVRAIYGMTLVTPQTGAQGKKVRRLLVEETLAIEKELYLGMTLDRARSVPVMMASAQGGMDIEEVAARDPKAIAIEPIDPLLGLRPYQARALAYALGLEGEQVARATALMTSLARLYEATDASLVEINPLVVVEGTGALLALDAKVTFDDNALFRHPEIRELRDPDEEDPLEVEASAHSLNYIKLDGNIACMVNGAGLAMATMDTIKLFGGSPANFLDVGGSATAERVTAAFKIMLSNRKVKAILVNIFGGIMKCDTIATGVVAAAREVKLSVPLVVRMKGTNEDLGKQILKDSGLPIISADNMADAAKKVVAAVKTP
jgi:succinyl-CoA synthetase beta subunit